MRIARIPLCIATLFLMAFVAAHAADKPKETKFVVQCADRSGTTFEVSEFVFNFGYSYPTPGWIGKTSTQADNPRTFIPFSYHGFVSTIPFGEITTVEFVDAPPKKETWNWEPSISVELRDGSTLTGGFGKYGEHTQQFRGNSELGKFALDIRKVKKIAFQHKTGGYTKRTPGKNTNMKSDYVLTIQTWNDKKLTINNGFVFRLDDGYKYENVSTAFGLKIGESEQRVTFDKVKELAFTMQDKVEAKLITVSGKIFPASITGHGLYIGGNIEKFGSGWIDLKKVRTLSVTK